MSSDSKIYLVSVDKFSELVRTIITLGCRQLAMLLIRLPDGLRWTKYPAVRNIHQNATERFLQTS